MLTYGNLSENCSSSVPLLEFILFALEKRGFFDELEQVAETGMWGAIMRIQMDTDFTRQSTNDTYARDISRNTFRHNIPYLLFRIVDCLPSN
ncbi:hypothetical protein WN48_00062 [Eufriesea mexicana]|nr:hypothetical protein WN48_00062 [Eufriesea mexicana]